MHTVNKMAKITCLDNSCKVSLIDCINNGDIWSIFIRDEYGILPVRGEMVIDIGVNNSDSPIYFCLQGASKVIALEPQPQNYNVAKTNIQLNALSDNATS